MRAGKKGKGGRPELLAPAGSPAAFEAALAAGADAVYGGAPGCNARRLAPDFSLAEIHAMVTEAHRRGRRFYLAMNSLVKEDEIPAAVDLLAAANDLQVDGVILQDLGVLRLARQLFPQLPLHASTLMGAHNHLAVRRLAAMGCSRVVLARECTLAEICRIAASSPVELEVFVHGAMCFSYSGLCLFSSYYGGKSGLRGRCVQPCRRRYTTGRGRDSGYHFSMRDLDGLDHVADLARAGIASLKIEGRMRNPRYVEHVVRAYRLVLDHPGENKAVAEARGILRGATLGRAAGPGYFGGVPQQGLVQPAHSGNTGTFAGRFTGGRSRPQITLRTDLAAGDRLRLHRERGGDRQAFTLRRLWLRGRPVARARAGATVTLEVAAQAGDSLYKVEDAGDRQRRQRPAWLAAAPMPRLRPAPPVPWPETAGKPRPGQGRWLLRLADPRRRQPRPAPDGTVVLLGRRTLAWFQGQRPAGDLIVGLPPVILEPEVAFFRDSCAALKAQGWHRWQIAHLGQLELLAPLDGLAIYGHYSLNVLNSLALAEVAAQGVGHCELLVETDGDNLRALLQHRPGGVRVGLTVYGRLPLFTSRVPLASFPGRRWFSPRDEGLRLLARYGQTVAVADEVLDLRPAHRELVAAGLDYVVVDLVCAAKGDTVSRPTKGRNEKTGGSLFNFAATLE